MARTRATLHTSIWNPDSDFHLLSASAQRLYFLILTQGDLSLCGVVSLTIERWARMSADTKPLAIKKALVELVEHRYLVVDTDTQEVWVRTFTTHDGVLRQPNMVVSMSKDFDAIQSVSIREGFVEGLPDGLVEGLPDGYRGRLAAPFLAWVLRTRARAPSPSPSPSPTSTPTHPKYEDDFNKCWEIYPRKESRKPSLKAYEARRSSGVSADTLLTATRHFADRMSKEERPQDKIMLGQTFFGPNDRWEDFVKAPPKPYVEPVARGADRMFPPGEEGERQRQEFYGKPIKLPGES